MNGLKRIQDTAVSKCGRPSLPPETVEAVLKAHRERGGQVSLRAIARETNISVGAVTKILDEAGVPRRRAVRKTPVLEKEEIAGAKARPSMAKVAALAGVSVSTVSLALRDNCRVSQATRDKVKSVAKMIGYTTHPYIGAQLAAVRRGRVAEVHAAMGYLYADSSVTRPWEVVLRQLYGPRRRFEAARKSAEKYGYALDVFQLRDPQMPLQRLQKVLENRGIRGLLLDFPAYLAAGREFDFQRFNCVSFGEQTEFRPHVFSNNDFQNILIAFCHLWRMGYRRIGFAIADSRMISSLFRPEAAFIHCQRHLVPESLRVPLLLEERWMEGYLESVRTGTPKKDRHRVGEFDWFNSQDWSSLDARLDAGADPVETTLEIIIQRWMDLHKPEAIICEDNHFRTRLEHIGYRVPKDVALVHTNLDADVQGWTGIRTAQEELADAAVRELNHSIEVGRFGESRNPLHVRFSGEWVEGNTTRRIRKPEVPLTDSADHFIRRVLNEPVPR